MRHQIKTLDELRQLASKPDGVDVSISTGLFNSSKHVYFNKDMNKWFIFNEIDNSEVECSSEEEIKEKSNILYAMEKGHLFQD